MKKPEPKIIRRTMFSCQVCVPIAWTDTQAIELAEQENPCGTEKGWTVRKDQESLQSDPERNPCAEFANFVHITLDA